jgi:tetratricopeptide (TPR) repeat protein
MRLGDFENADASFKEAKKHSPGSQLAYQGLAILSYLAGDLERGRLNAEHALSLGPYPPLQLLIARIDYLEGKDGAALARLKMWKKQSGSKYLPRSMVVMGYSKQHDFRFDPFEAEIYDSPGAILARSIDDQKKESRRRSYTRQGKVDESLTQARRRFAINGSDFVAAHETGLLQLSVGDYSAASLSFQNALKICPDCRVDALYLAEAFARTGSGDDARKCIAYYREAYPNQTLASRYLKLATAGDTTASAPVRPPAPAGSSPAPLLPGEGGPPKKDGPSAQSSPF